MPEIESKLIELYRYLMSLKAAPTSPQFADVNYEETGSDTVQVSGGIPGHSIALTILKEKE